MGRVHFIPDGTWESISSAISALSITKEFVLKKPKEDHNLCCSEGNNVSQYYNEHAGIQNGASNNRIYVGVIQTVLQFMLLLECQHSI